jgi:hypothetical protein
MSRFRKLWWWLWTLTGIALVANLAGWAPGLRLAVALTLAQVVHQAVHTRSLWAMPVQVRYLFLLVLLVGALPGFAVVHVLQVAGIIVRVGLDYCVASRLLWLLPFNHRGPLTLAGVRTAFQPTPQGV